MSELVLLHGFTGSPASYADVLAALPTERTRALPLLGHGAPDDAGVTTFAAELARLTTQLPLAACHLVGYSLGARLALGVALEHPERVARLTLISGQPGLASAEERAARRRADAHWCELLETRGLAAFVAAWEAQPLFATQDRLPAAARERRQAVRLAHDPRGLARSLRVCGLGEMPDYLPQLAALALPVTLLAGELDPKFLELARTMAARLPNARVAVAPSAGHDLLLEAPALVARELASPVDHRSPLTRGSAS